MTEIPSLDARKAAVLRAIVSYYVGSGEPVGSRTIVERGRLDVSPATVRNEMAALEEAGLIYQPHTSAGRIPTDSGYRYFVDTWGSNVRLPAAVPPRTQRQILLLGQVVGGVRGRAVGVADLHRGWALEMRRGLRRDGRHGDPARGRNHR